MRFAIIAIAGLAFPVVCFAQSAAPPQLAAVETARSRACVPVLARVDSLDARLAPLATRTNRLLAIARAIALEDRSVIATLDNSDDLESRVRAWFVSDSVLAQQYVSTPNPETNLQRSVARENIKVVMEEAVGAVQFEGDSIIASNQALAVEARQCDGAIFIRNVVLEACGALTSDLCDGARTAPSPTAQFRFVDDAASMWDVEEIRPWSNPTGLVVDEAGQLDGARSFVYARVGNVIVTVAFSPLLLDRADAPPERLQRFQLVNDSLGLTFSHPDLAFAPAMGVRASLPHALGGESRYIIHFGDPASPEILWVGAANSGAPLESTVALRAGHVRRLQDGEPLTLSAMRPGTEGEEPAFVIELTNVNQAPALTGLLGYMASRLSEDLAQIIPPKTGS